jgi:PAS domain S-box-containing protein
VRPRQIAPVALVLGLTVAGFFGARLLGERDARRNSEHRAAVAAAQISGRVEQGASLAESLRRFMVGVAGSGVTGEEFVSNASRWLSPAGFPAAAWVEQVPAYRRAAYERRIGHPIVTRDRRGRIVPVGPRSSYLPATLVSGIPPMAVPGIDLGSEPDMVAALARAGRLYDVGATPLTTLRDGTKGLFLVKLAPRLARGVLEPGFVVVFLSELWLRAAATDTPMLQLTVGNVSTGDIAGAAPVRAMFTQAGQRFEVGVPRSSVQGAATVLPWIILAAGLVLAALAGALGVNAARRARAQRELDRIFTLSSDLIAVVDFDGHFTRVNPAVEQVLGYTRGEFLARPYLDLVHPDDRERTAAETAAISQGKTTLSFENRYVRKDGSPRVLEWASTPVVEERLMYAVARDVTERRQAEAELERLAGEQAALRRVATLVARGVPPEQVFAAVTEEVGRLLPVDHAGLGRYEPDSTVTTVAAWSRTGNPFPPVGSRWTLDGKNLSTIVFETGRRARVDSYPDSSAGPLGVAGREAGISSSVGTPIIVEGRLWGTMSAGSRLEQPLPADTEARLADFTELLATAIANAESRAALAASRARVVTAADETRRRIERDLHDGTQQQLVSLMLELRAAEATEPADVGELRAQLARTARGLGGVLEELQEISRGIHPPALSRGGLQRALRVLARRSAVPVELDVRAERRLPEQIEVAAYYVVSEALTNAAKHAHASLVHVELHAHNAAVRLAIRDDGVGGADPRRGSGLVGLSDRIEALGGTLEVTSPARSGTTLLIEIPLERQSSAGTPEP